METSGSPPTKKPKSAYATELRVYLDTVEGRQGVLKTAVAEELWRAMESRGLSKAELARRAKVTPQYLTKVFKGTTNFTLETVVALFHLLDYDFEFKVQARSGSPLPVASHFPVPHAADSTGKD